MYDLSRLQEIRERAERNGFVEISFLKVKNPSQAFRAFYRKYLGKKFHAEMNYLENTRAKFDLSLLWPHSGRPRSMMVGLYPYKHILTERELKKSPYKIARYAWGKDYHIHLRKKLKKVFEDTGAHRIIIDSTPLPERYYARKAGLGFIGKNGMLIHPRLGSYFFLVFVLLPSKISSHTLRKFNKEKDGIPKVETGDAKKSIRQDMLNWCSDCRRCVDSCPTNALEGDGELNANACISYWSIESKSEKIGLKKKIGKWIFGCDICQMVCPYNKFSIHTLDNAFAPHETTLRVSQGKTDALKDSDFHGLPLKRAGLKNLRRNIDFTQKFI